MGDCRVVSQMDLVRAIAFLRAADDAAASSNTREAVDACRIAAKHVIDPSIRYAHHTTSAILDADH